MFNPRPTIRLVPIPGHSPCVVIDDFLLDPMAMVNVATHFRGSFFMKPQNAFPGPELPTPEIYSLRMNDFFVRHVSHILGAGPTHKVFSRLSMTTLQPDKLSPYQRICHRDNLATDPKICFAACVLYLFQDERLGGTGFYVPKVPRSEIDRIFSEDSEWKRISSADFTEEIGAEPAYPSCSNKYFELVCAVPPAWNRVIFFDSSIFHSGHITEPERLNPDPLRGRLTLNSFFTCHRSAVVLSD